MDMKSLPGVFDILPEDQKEPWRQSHIWAYLEKVIRETAKNYGFQEIRTPILERTELFLRGVGETTDIVSKEMYTFEDKGKRSITMRPEGTAPVIRAYIEHNLNNARQLHKLFYICPMFRYERSQAGRYRQHHQFGVEVIGSAAPEQDAELIDLLYTLCATLGLKNLRVLINSIGDPASRLAYRKALQDFLFKSFDQLSADSKIRFEANPLRILDSKDPQDKEIIKNAPSILDYLTPECKEHFQGVQKFLDLLKIPYEVDPKIVRGLDYYNKTVFEIVSEELGSQNTVGGGGRYDGLVSQLGGPNVPSLGFGSGLERIIQVMLKQNVPIPTPDRALLYFIPLGQKAKETCFQLMHQLRQNGFNVQMELSDRKLNKAMQYANQIQVKFASVIGDNEIASGQAELKEMATGQTTLVQLNVLVHFLETRK